MKRYVSILLVGLLGPAASLAAQPFDPQAAAALIERGEAGEASELLEARLETADGDLEARYWLARAELARIDDANAFRKPFLARSAKNHLEQVLAEDPAHLAAREALARYLLEAPAIVGGSVDRAKEESDRLLEQHAPTGFRVKSAIALQEGDSEGAVDMLRRALEAEPWTWEAQYTLIVQAVHRQTASAPGLLDAAERNVRTRADDPAALLPLVDYQRGKLAAVGGAALEDGRAALLRYLEYTPGEGEPALVWAQFRLAQVERQLGLVDAAEGRLERLEDSQVPENLSFALRDERRWHYSHLN